MSRDLYTLEDILCPRSVAILGASRSSHKSITTDGHTW